MGRPTYEYYSMMGGEDLITPGLRIKPGSLLLGKNYECLTLGGYKSIQGFERFSGMPKPSAASYWVLNFENGGSEISVADIVDGDGGASGEALVITVSSGTWAGGDAAGYLILFNVTGTFVDGEDLDVSAVKMAEANGVAANRGATNDTDDATWLQLAIEATRADILIVPGSGNMRGVWVYKGIVYAARDNAGATAADIYKSSAAGWVLVDKGSKIAYTSGGTTKITVGEVLTGATSGAFGTVAGFYTDSGMWSGSNYILFTSGGPNIIEVGEVLTGATSSAGGTVDTIYLTSGAWETNDAAGRIYLNNVTGTFQAEILDALNEGNNIATCSGAQTSTSGDAAGTIYLHTITGDFQAENLNGSVSGANCATCSGIQTASVLTNGGRYEFKNYNFGGHADSLKMYATNGVDRAWQWDGTGFTFIETGMTTDTPSHVNAHKNHLFLSFTGGSIQHSSITNPLEWNVVTGAAELNTGDEITGMIPVPGQVLAVFNRNQTLVLYGSSTLDWNLQTHSEESGAIEWSMEKMGYPRYLDDRGLMHLPNVQEYGDFAANTFSQKIQPLLDSKKSLVTASMRVRKKNQYRIFFSDNTGITSTYDGTKLVGFTRQDYGLPVLVTCSAEDTNGDEVLYFGSNDGYIYQMDSGTSFDGTAIETILRPIFNHSKSPQNKKYYRKVVLEVDITGSTELQFTPDYSYADPKLPVGATQTNEVEGGGGFWDDGIWGAFLWSSKITGSLEAYVKGSGQNLGMIIRSSEAYEPPHTIQSATVHYSMRGLKR